MFENDGIILKTISCNKIRKSSKYTKLLQSTVCCIELYENQDC